IWSVVEPIWNSRASRRIIVIPRVFLNLRAGASALRGGPAGVVLPLASGFTRTFTRKSRISGPNLDHPAHARPDNAARQATTPERLSTLRLRQARRLGVTGDGC